MSRKPLERTVQVPTPRGDMLTQVVAWGRDLVKFLVNELTKLHEFLVTDLVLNKYLTAGRPTLTVKDSGTVIYVTDAAAGSKFQGWDGTAWVSLG